MRLSTTGIGCVVAAGIAAFGAMALLNGNPGHAQTAPPAAAVPAANQPPPDPLVWDATQKDVTPEPGADTAEFTFSVTNISDYAVVIDSVHPSCGCTTAKLPAEPWIIGPRTNSSFSVSMLLQGKSGDVAKTVTVVPSNAPAKTLVIVAHLPVSPEQMRIVNQQMALVDRQNVFKGDCAKCHTEKSVGKMGEELYTAACGICHDSEHRATMVPNLRALNKPTGYDYWKQWITLGKPGTLMPAFASSQGGPLTDEQIESLAKTLVTLIPSSPMTNSVSAGSTNQSGGAIHPKN